MIVKKGPSLKPMRGREGRLRDIPLGLPANGQPAESETARQRLNHS